MRAATLCSALAELSAKGEVVRDAKGYQLKLPFPVSHPIDPHGKRKWETLRLLQRRIGQRWEATRAPIGRLANSKGAGRKRLALHSSPCWSKHKAINPRGSGGQRHPVLPNSSWLTNIPSLFHQKHCALRHETSSTLSLWRNVWPLSRPSNATLLHRPPCRGETGTFCRLTPSSSSGSVATE